MKATFQNTNAGDQITLDGTLCEVLSKGSALALGMADCIVVGPVNVDVATGYAPDDFDAAGYLHLAGREAEAEEPATPAIAE